MAGSLLTFSFPLLSEKERVNTSDIKLSECSWYKSYEMTTWMVCQLLFSIPRFKKWKTNWYQPLSTAATVWYLKYHIYVPLQYVFQYLAGTDLPGGSISSFLASMWSCLPPHRVRGQEFCPIPVPWLLSVNAVRHGRKSPGPFYCPKEGWDMLSALDH